LEESSKELSDELTTSKQETENLQEQSANKMNEWLEKENQFQTEVCFVL